MRIPIQAMTTGIVIALMALTECSAAPAVALSTGVLSDSVMGEQLGTTVRNGTVLSLNPTHMVISRRHKGKTAPLDLVLDDVTVRRGEIAVGSQVTVHYRTHNNRNFATSIQLRQSLNRLESEPAPQ